MTPDRVEFPEAYLEGVRLFNAREFFACHDVLEELWTDTLGPERTFYQGLIHAAVSLFHFEEGNLGGARKMHDSTRKYLEPFAPDFMGLDLAGFLMDYKTCFQPLLDAGSSWPTGLAIDPETLPPLRWKAEARHHA
jgi:predicted metal-dependent hydrolase